MGIAVGNGCTGTEIGVCGGERDKYDAEYLIRTGLVRFLPHRHRDWARPLPHLHQDWPVSSARSRAGAD